MTDPIRDILRSPLDDIPESRVSPRDAAVVALAILIGVVAGWIAGAPAEITTTTTTTDAPAAPVPLDLPPGWVDTGLGYAVGVNWMYTRGPDLVIGVSTATRAGQDPVVPGTTDLGFDRVGIGIWTLELSGGERITNTRELFDFETNGVVTVVFAGAGATAEDVRGLTLRPVVGTGTRTHQVSLQIEGLPQTFTRIEPLAATELIIPTDDGTTSTDLTWVAIDELAIDWSNAAVSWSLQDTPDVRVMVQTTMSIEGDTDEPVVLQTVNGGGAFLQRSFPPMSPASSGISVLRKTGGATRETYTPDRAAVSFVISWLRYGDEEVGLDVTGATILDPIE